MTFGYDSNWNKIWKSNNVLDIPDFSRQLVNDLWLHYADQGDVRQSTSWNFFNICRRKLSLSLTVWAVLSSNRYLSAERWNTNLSQALIISHNNSRYSQIKKNTIGIAFLGTPHRGADLAKMLKALLDVSFAERKFVKDLLPGSQIIKEINNDFADHTQVLQLASFSESTGMTLVGVNIPYVISFDDVDCGPRVFGYLGIAWRNSSSAWW